MRVWLYKQFERLFGYCLKHNRYSGCPQCHIERLLKQPAINPPSNRQMTAEFRALQQRFQTIMTAATKEAMSPTINEEQFEAINEDMRRWNADEEAWKAKYAGPLKLSTHFDCEGGDR